MSLRFWPNKPILLNLQLHALFYTIFSFLTPGTNFKKSNAYAECFDTNFKEEDSCARCLAEVLAFQQYGQIRSKNDNSAEWLGASFKQ